MIKKIIQIFATPLLLGLIVLFLQSHAGEVKTIWILSRIFLFLTAVAYLFAFPALLYYLREELSIIESYRKTKNIIFSLIFILILSSILAYGGFLFLIIPGFLFLVWFSFAPFVLIFEGKKGFSALWRSRKMVDGRFWIVFGRIFFIALCFGILRQVAEGIVGDTGSTYFLVSYFIVFLNQLVLWLSLFFLYEEERENVTSEYIPSKLSKAFLVIAAIPGTVIFLLIFLISFNHFFRNYDPPFDDSFIAIEEKDVSMDGNLFFFLKENKGDDLEVIDLRTVIGKQTNYDFIVENSQKAREIIDGNARAYDYFEKMTAHNHFMSPLVFWAHLDYDVLDNSINTLAISRAVSFKTSYYFYEDRVEEGMNLLLENIRMGSLFASDEHQDLAILLIGLMHHDIAYDISDSLSKIDISKEQAIFYGEKLEELEIEEGSLAKVFQREYMMIAETLNSDAEIKEIFGEDISANYVRDSFFFMPNKTKKEIAKIYYVEVSPESGRIEEAKNLQKEVLFFNPSFVNFFLHYVIKGNIVGEVMTSRLINAINAEKILEDIRRSNFQNRATRINLSLNAYKNENDKYPESLEDLVPHYLSEIPKDPFYEDRDIQYSKQEGIIYSGKMKEVSNWEKERYLVEF